MWDVEYESREYGKCYHCGFEGIGMVQYVADDYTGDSATVYVCDICEKASDQ